jgi:phage shock protein C
MNENRLVRTRDRWILGVCGGIARHFGWPADRVRLAYLLLSILSAAFPGILLYLLLALVMPAEPGDE